MFASSDFRHVEPRPSLFGPFGQLTLPYTKMGAIDSLDLFGLDELIIFSFYWANRQRYRCALDIGANVGLHSILMSKCSFKVKAFEPDPIHYDLLQRNLQLNGTSNVVPYKAAISTHNGTMEFVRVKGNTTSSHLAGAKANPYGELERFPVEVKSFAEASVDADFVKIDAEGHEVAILRALPIENWARLDAIVEVGTPENAAAIFYHFRDAPVNLFSQKTGWQKIKAISDIPSSYREGSLFISSKSQMPW